MRIIVYRENYNIFRINVLIEKCYIMSYNYWYKLPMIGGGKMREHFYQKTNFKNIVLIALPSAISVIGVLISIFQNPTYKIIAIFTSIILLLLLIGFIIFFSYNEDKIYNELKDQKERNFQLTNILAHMENENKAMCYTVSVMSELSESWASSINSFVKNTLSNGVISDKAWDKTKIVDGICVCCRDMIKQYCNNYDNSKISVGFISCTTDENGEKWVKITSHSNPESTRPHGCKEKQKLLESMYHYAELIKEELSDIEIAMNNVEIQNIFKKITPRTDLSKYTQYIAVPIYCKSRKLLGIFQIVTKNGYIIETERDNMEKFVTEKIIPFSNLIVLSDKIYKGLYISPSKINKEE